MAKAESKTILKAYSTVESKLPTLPLEDGQLIFVYDKKKIILDNHGVRTVYEQIQTIETEEQRNDLLAPIDSFYFVIETSILWRYTNGHWNQITTSPQEQIDRIVAEGTRQVKAVQDKGTEVLQSIPEDFQTQMETKLNKQQGIENKGKVLVIGEDGNVVPEEVASGGGDGIAIINTMSGESPLVIPDSAERVNKRLELGGKTEQVQTTGKNLFDSNIAKNKENYKEVTIAGSVIYAIELSLKPNTKYAFQCVIKSVPTTMNVGNSTIRYVVSDGQKRVITTNEDGKLYIGFSGNPDGEIHKIGVSIVDIQVEESTTVTPYEPYTGGKPSPSPEYPQEIKNSGKWNEETQKYEVDVKVTGKNLLDTYEKAEKDSEFYSVNDDGSLSQLKSDVRPYSDVPSTLFLKSGVYYFSLFNTGVTFKCYNAEADEVFAEIKEPKSILVNLRKDANIKYKVFSNGGSSKNVRVMVSKTKASEYEPYTEQTLTLTSDRQLTKWDRLVEQGGQIGWLYGSEILQFTDAEGFKFFHNAQNKAVVNVLKAIDPDYSDSFSVNNSYCTHFINNIQAYYDSGDTCSFTLSTRDGNCLYFKFGSTSDISDLEKFEKWILEKRPVVIYKTKDLQFIPLPQSEQNAIRALKTYYPTTVITADGGELDPDIKVTYTADTKNYIDNKVSAKVASIIRQYRLNTANLLSLMPMETQAAMIENDTNNILENAEEMKHE